MVKKNIKKYITFSIDDGSKYDLRLLKLLEKYKLKATFYIPKHDESYHKKDLTDKEIRIISQVQEVGSHSLTHPILDRIPLFQQKEEIFDSKKYLENLLGKEVSMFCYPHGIYNNRVSYLVREAGYIGARTVKCCYFRIDNPFEMNVSLHIYPYPLLKKNKEYSYFFWGKNLLRPLSKYRRVIKECNLGYGSYFSWFRLAKNMFDYVYENGGIFHVFGHSWEIEKFNLWKDLEKLFRYLPKEKDIIYLNNGDIIKELNFK